MPVGVCVLRRHRVLNLLQQRGNPLRLAVGVLALFNRPFERILNRLRGVKMRLPNAEIDGVLHLCRKVKDFANPRGINLVQAIRNPTFAHGWSSVSACKAMTSRSGRTKKGNQNGTH